MIRKIPSFSECCGVTVEGHSLSIFKTLVTALHVRHSSRHKQSSYTPTITAVHALLHVLAAKSKLCLKKCYFSRALSWVLYEPLVSFSFLPFELQLQRC